MTFVTLAGSSLACSSLENRTVPVSFSISKADGAATSTALALVPRIRTAHTRAIAFFIQISPLRRYLISMMKRGHS